MRSSTAEIGIRDRRVRRPERDAAGAADEAARRTRPRAGASQSTSLTLQERVGQRAGGAEAVGFGDAAAPEVDVHVVEWFSTCHSVKNPSSIRCGRTSLITDASIPAG